MATFSDLQTSVQRRVIDAPSSVQTEVPRAVNKAYRKLQTQHNFWLMRATSAIVTNVISGRALAPLPSDFKEYREAPYRVQNTGSAVKMAIYPNLRTAIATTGELAAGNPISINETMPNDLGLRSWEVWPLPDGNSDYIDGEYRIYIPYWRFLPALSGANDENWFTINAEAWIVNKATALCFEVAWDQENAVLWESLAKGEWKDVVTADTRLIMSQIDTFVPHHGPNDLVWRS